MTISQSTKIILSDFHAGAPTSLLTVLDSDLNPLPHKISDTSASFGVAFQATLAHLNLTAKPDLVLMGDAMDLSFSTPDTSAAILQPFLDAIMKDNTGAPAFNQVFFLPGNHDHELWTAQRFSRAAQSTDDPTDPGFWAHTSPAFASADRVGTTNVLNEIIASIGLTQKVATYYPNHGTLCPDKNHALILHHGHFVEDMYKVMSSIMAVLSGESSVPMTAESLEQANGSWIDFLWSTIGDGGLLGKNVTVAQNLLQTGGASHLFQNRVAELLATQLQKVLPLPHMQAVTDALEIVTKGLVDAVLGKFSQLERFSYTKYLSDSNVEGLRSYIAEVVRSQMLDELGDSQPTKTTFVFGHTHKPFEDQLVVPGFAAPVSVYNTGGWMMDTALLSTVEGASIVFADEAHNTAAIRAFEMPINNEMHLAYVVSADTTPDTENPMFTKLSAAVDAAHKEWQDFAKATHADLLKKQDMFMELGKRMDAQHNFAGPVA